MKVASRHLFAFLLLVLAGLSWLSIPPSGDLMFRGVVTAVLVVGGLVVLASTVNGSPVTRFSTRVLRIVVIWGGVLLIFALGRLAILDIEPPENRTPDLAFLLFGGAFAWALCWHLAFKVAAAAVTRLQRGA